MLLVVLAVACTPPDEDAGDAASAADTADDTGTADTADDTGTGDTAEDTASETEARLVIQLDVAVDGLYAVSPDHGGQPISGPHDADDLVISYVEPGRWWIVAYIGDPVVAGDRLPRGLRRGRGLRRAVRSPSRRPAQLGQGAGSSPT